MENKEIIKLLIDKIQEQSDEIARLRIMLNVYHHKTIKVTVADLKDMFNDDDFWDIEKDKTQDTELSRKQNMIDDNFGNIEQPNNNHKPSAQDRIKEIMAQRNKK